MGGYHVFSLAKHTHLVYSQCFDEVEENLKQVGIL